ncbi:MAG TPA: dipeptidase [Nocardioidaceae bacterium]|nr:dipeptidase [Nocardioidaceae bacterium]
MVTRIEPRSEIADWLRAVPLVDGHNDYPWSHRDLAGYDLDAMPFDVDQPRLHTDLRRLHRGGVGAQFWSVFVPASLAGDAAVTATLEQVAFVRRLADRYPTELALATTADGVDAAVASGRIACLMGAEGGHQINQSLGVLAMLHTLGVRYLTLTHNDNVPWADSATDEPAHGGLTEFGHDVVREMNRLGMIVDLSHVSADTMRDALRTTRAPVMFSHSNARAVCDVSRNVPDDVLGSLRANGGVCMVTFVPVFTSAAAGAWYEECQRIAVERGLDPRRFSVLDPIMAERAASDDPLPAVTIDDVVAHVEYVRDVAGVDAVGLGGDFDGTQFVTNGLADVAAYPALFEKLDARGWSRDDLAKLAGRNALRVLRDVEAVAATYA